MRRLSSLGCCLLLGGCLTIGPDRLSHDQIGFSRALAISQNEQTLLNIVRLRYAEAPTFLDLTQVISGYQAQQNVTGSFNLYPRDNLNTYLGGGGSLQLQESPTFTYAPVIGDQFADSFLRPLPPESVLPLALSGIPIDILFKLVVQSINGAQNLQVLSGTSAGASTGFDQLLRDLRVLQVAGLLDVRVGHGGKPVKGTERAEGIFVSIRPSDDPALTESGREVKALLGLSPSAGEFEVVYGLHPSAPDQVAMLTRSMLAVLGSVAFAIDVPAVDVVRGKTLPTKHGASTLRISSGAAAPSDAFVSVEYDDVWFWISSDDFRSKLTFAVLQNLLALAQTHHAPGAVVTIPTG